MNEALYANFVQSKLKNTLVDGLKSGSRDIDELNILHAAVGIAGEAGELLDAVKKMTFGTKPYDMVKLVEEMGDLEYYLAAMRTVLTVSRETVLRTNVEKLNVRHPDRK